MKTKQAKAASKQRNSRKRSKRQRASQHPAPTWKWQPTTTGDRPATCVGTGLVALDVVFGRQRREGETWAGGSCGNVLAVLGWLGWSCKPAARLGVDRAAARVLEDLASCGVDTEAVVVDESVATPVIIEVVSVGRDGLPRHRFLFRCPECDGYLPQYRALRLEHVEPLLEKHGTADVFYFDRVSPAACRLAEAYRSRGALVVFEPSGINDDRLFAKALAHTHVLKYSHERLGDALGDYSDSGVQLEVETLGDEGLNYRLRVNGRLTKSKFLPAFPAPAVLDTAGAGDWCTAGLIHRLRGTGWLKQRSARPVVEEALRFGQVLAAVNCEFEGARGGVYAKSRVELEARIDAVASGGPVIPFSTDLTSGKAEGAVACLECGGARASANAAT